MGLNVDTRNTANGTFELGHTEERRSESKASIEALLGSGGPIKTKSLEQLHGRLVWFRSFVFGRKLNWAVRVVSKFSRTHEKRVGLTDSLVAALKCLDGFLSTCQNVKVGVDISATWVVFTDGAYEPDQNFPATVGGVLVNPQGQVVSYFVEVLPQSLLSEFLEASRHPIYELEIFPVVIAVRLWAKHLAGNFVVHYLDNNAALGAFIRADSATELGKALLKGYLDFEERLKLRPWFARVPSHSNLSDAPSRLDFTSVYLRDAAKSEPSLPAHLADWGISRVR